MKTQSKELALALIRVWFKKDSKDVLPYLRELRNPVRTGPNRRLSAVRLNGDDIEFAFISNQARTYNPHDKNCWTPSSALTPAQLFKIQRKLR